jgi:hypothetical protein
VIMGLATPTRQEPLKIRKGPDTILAWIGRDGSAGARRLCRDATPRTKLRAKEITLGGKAGCLLAGGSVPTTGAAPQVEPTAIQPGETASGNSRVVGEDGVSKRLQCLLNCIYLVYVLYRNILYFYTEKPNKKFE